MKIPIEELFEYDEFKITVNKLKITIKWQDYMNRKNFFAKVNDTIKKFEKMPVEMIYNGENVELSYLIGGGIIDCNIELC